MDRQAAYIREEMSQVRADLDQKISALEARAHEMTPRRYLERVMPDYLAERVIGTALTLGGAVMIVKRFRNAARRRARIRNSMLAYGRS